MLKVDCLDLPPKTYQVVEVELTEEQSLLYKEMKETCVAQLKETELTANNALTMAMRLHQIVCGVFKSDDGQLHELDTKRLPLLLSIIDGLPGKTIIWCNYTPNIRSIVKSLSETYGPESVVSYYGETSFSNRVGNIDRFQHSPGCRFFVANRTGSEGITLTAATTSIYYSNDYRLGARLQSEDRPHRIGQTKPVLYIDLVSPGTIDMKIYEALKNKKHLADEVLDYWGEIAGDEFGRPTIS